MTSDRLRVVKFTVHADDTVDVEVAMFAGDDEVGRFTTTVVAELGGELYVTIGEMIQLLGVDVGNILRYSLGLPAEE